ncbi:hypothetical protein MMC17_000934 [Xylographa soralifera]|nr:hypothetical protein [Xylographa soralifera]
MSLDHLELRLLTLLASLSLLGSLSAVNAIHHMKRAPLQYVSQRDESRPLTITNQCPELIYPGLATQAGTPPSTQGFPLAAGDTMELTVGADWQGRVWGRTNCSFNADGSGPSNTGGNNGGGSACVTGDCNGVVNCVVTVSSASCRAGFGSKVLIYKNKGNTPVTLAEFTLASSTGQTYYDISLVDGYNIPIGIVALYTSSGNSSLTDIPPNLTNPVCIGTAALLAAQGDTTDATLGSNSSYPIPLDQSQSTSDVQGWCPWDLQLSPPTKPGDGVYPYPDDNIQRPLFNPCYSACAKYNDPSDCCTGSYDNPSVCQPSLYSQDAKAVCPDAYSYAFDDQTSTFIIPSGGGFQVIFCPPGRSTNIINTMKPELEELSQTGHVTPQLLADSSNLTLIQLQSDGMKRSQAITSGVWVTGTLVLFGIYYVGVW